ncbi:flagellar basal body P-ring formation protein FlgA [Spongiibacter sp. KMU-158]|uniref:Flagella basal body P-ring formation protein FlgA n=1 Tax=Spongiibacter pelagi TaxID=2760804 RepID=A0A927GVH7_9GAMM|nr:flagellar basal body P-ring formation chaperone FlgA [Spongiibacter pelagi]MBD2858410.1 flagellar basal body P-ring formation protein FlgA [Spongiibacter pelagi]
MKQTPRKGQLLITLLFTLLALPVSSTSLAADGSKESHARIAEVARQYIAARNPWRDMKNRIEVGQLDPRSQLAKCPIKPEAFLPPGSRIKRRTTVGIRCPGNNGWKIYLPVNIAAYARVMVAKHPIPPGTRISESDISWSERDIATLSYGYLNNLDGAGGYKAKRAISQGAVISTNMVEADSIIAKGQRVELISQHGTVSVSMMGIALQDAALGQRVLVKNLSSGKQLEGIVESNQRVIFN